MRHLRIALAVLFMALGLFQPAFADAVKFDNAQSAQRHCPNDVVVWVNLKSGIYHFKGERWYGRTKDGAYVCQQEADNEGDRATKNGQ
jgi:hypothetical protein